MVNPTTIRHNHNRGISVNVCCFLGASVRWSTEKNYRLAAAFHAFPLAVLPLLVERLAIQRRFFVAMLGMLLQISLIGIVS